MAYGARLESVLGESPRGLESPILRQNLVTEWWRKLSSKKEKITPRDSKAIADLVDVVRPKRILEFGSWQGRSALKFLKEQDKHGIAGEITCVDTWLGSPEHWDPSNQEGEWGHHNLQVTNGEPQIMDVFRGAIESYGYSKRTKILRCSTSSSEKFLKDSKYEPDLIYVDADHSTQAVRRDIDIAYRLSPTGVISGDDWCWPSVQLGVALASWRLGARIMVAQDDFGWVLLKNESTQRTQFLDLGWRMRNPGVVLGFVILHRTLRSVRSKSPKHSRQVS